MTPIPEGAGLWTDRLSVVGFPHQIASLNTYSSAAAPSPPALPVTPVPHFQFVLVGFLAGLGPLCLERAEFGGSPYFPSLRTPKEGEWENPGSSPLEIRRGAQLCQPGL